MLDPNRHSKQLKGIFALNKEHMKASVSDVDLLMCVTAGAITSVPQLSLERKQVKETFPLRNPVVYKGT